MGWKKGWTQFSSLIDDSRRGGLQIPNFKLYQESIWLCWLREWIIQSNEKLLNLEGFNTRFGWHAYLFFEKHTIGKK